MELLNRDKRDSYIYDSTIKGFDANFWKQIAGTTTIASNKMRLNAATQASFILHEFAFIDIKINVPAKPTAGDSRRWGLFAPSASGDQGAIYFDITGTAFTANVIDANGQTQTSTLTWNDGSWSATDIIFTIKWEPDIVQFWVNGTILATFQVISASTAKGIPFIALPLYFKNGNSDNMDISYIAVQQAAGIV